MLSSWAHQLQEALPRFSDLCRMAVPQENGCLWKCMSSQLTEEDFLLEEEGVDSPER